MNMSRILFVYPNKEGYPIIPLGISVLSGILRHHKHEVDLFDITFMMSERYDHDAREKTGVVKKVDVEKYWGSGDKTDIYSEFRKKILLFEPDLIAFSIVENNYAYSKKLFKIAKEVTKAPIIVGGLFPTTMPERFVEDSNVDIICIGEGEYAMERLADKLDQGQDITDISNLIVKDKGKVIKNGYAKYYDWEPPVLQDWSIFDKRHLIKPFMGKMYRTGFFELSRGCPNNCSYCNNHLNQIIFKGLGRYNREKPVEYAIKEIEHMKNKYSLELVFFNDENFLTMKKERLSKFCNEYKNRVNLPFFIMTRADSLLDEQSVAMLKEAGCVTIGIGVESGNEEIRRKLLNKNISNLVYEKAFEICHKHGIRTTANIMMGLPFETEENILESARFCKKVHAKSLSLAIFAPYYGTKLRDICVENGFMEDKLYEEISIVNHSILNMPQLSKNKIEELYYKFNDLVYGASCENKDYEKIEG
jgi:anaerobic magnesium-protoporphyrin IX monomethyl ester cyclase